MSKFMSLIRRAPKRTSALVAIIAAAIIVPATLFAWGPSRDTYTVAHPATKVTFNSITDNPNVGDERNFVVVKDAAITTDGGWQDNVTVQPGKEYLVRVYVHNNAASSLNLTALNTRVSASVPTTTGKAVSVSGFVSADNSDPLRVWDDIHFNSDKTFNLAYVPGSAEIYNNGYAAGGKTLSDSIVTSAGALVGYNGPDGKVPGCFQYVNYVYFKVKPQFAPESKFTMSKMVSKHGENKWVENYTAQPGEKVDYLIQYKNTGAVVQNDVTIRDTLPTGMSYVKGSTIVGNGSHPAGVTVSDNIANGTGINIGAYAPGASAWAIFSAKAPVNDYLAICGTNTLVNKAKVTTGGGSIEDTANVTVTKKCEEKVPVYTCDTLTVKRIERTKFSFTTAYTVDNATFKNVTYIVRDASGKEVARTVSTNPTITYTQATVGSYTVQSIITVTVDGKDKTATSEGCKGKFEVPKNPEYCKVPGKEHLPVNSPDCVTTPMCTVPGKEHLPANSPDCVTTTPPELPKTGAGENIVAFLGLGALIASIGYYVASRRAALNQ